MKQGVSLRNFDQVVPELKRLKAPYTLRARMVASDRECERMVSFLGEAELLDSASGSAAESADSDGSGGVQVHPQELQRLMEGGPLTKFIVKRFRDQVHMCSLHCCNWLSRVSY